MKKSRTRRTRWNATTGGTARRGAESSERRTEQRSVEPARSLPQLRTGPYETHYSISTGYCDDRVIVIP